MRTFLQTKPPAFRVFRVLRVFSGNFNCRLRYTAEPFRIKRAARQIVDVFVQRKISC